MKSRIVALIVLMLTSSVHAAEPESGASPDSGDGGAESSAEWSGTLAAGALFASGNTESESVNLDATTELAHGVWRHSLRVTGYEASEEGQTTAERYKAAVQSNYSFSLRSYLFVRGNYESDRFGPFDRRASVTTGLGRRVVETADMTLDLEGGVGRRISEPSGTNDREGEAIARASGNFVWAFAETSRFTQALEIESGASNTASESISSIRSRLLEDLFWRLSHTVAHNSDVPAGTEKTDTFTAIAVEYAF